MTPPLKKIDHIAIAVRDIETAISTYERMLGTRCYKRETVDDEGVETAFFRNGDSKLELIAATSPDSPLARFFDNHGEGIHHIAYEVDDIRAEMQRYVDAGFTLLNDEPKRGADNHLIAFLHPKGLHGVLVELCQTSPDEEKQK